MRRSDQRNRTRPELPRNTPATGLERATQFFHWTQAGGTSGIQWVNAWGGAFDFVNSAGGIIRFYGGH